MHGQPDMIDTPTHTVSSTIGLELLGEDDGEHAGAALAAGDFNCDGLVDLAIGAPQKATGGAMTGAVYVVNGAYLPEDGSLDLSDADHVIFGEVAGDTFGHALSAGDVNGDGCADLAVGAPFHDAGGVPNSGRIYLFSGIDLMDTGTAVLDAHAIDGEGLLARAGWSVHLGLIDDDGEADLVVGAPWRNRWASSGTDRTGRAYLVYDTSVAALSTLADADTIWLGQQPGSQAGHSVSSAGLLNNAEEDVLIGAPRFSWDDGSGAVYSSAGKAYVIDGSGISSGMAMLAAADYSALGQNAGDRLGWAVSGGGDLDDSSTGEEWLVGSPGWDCPSDPNCGAGWVVQDVDLANYAGSGAVIDIASHYTVAGNGTNALGGVSLLAVGDMDGDGVDDAAGGAIGAGGAGGAGEVTIGWTL